jgi:LysM repeat protein
LKDERFDKDSGIKLDYDETGPVDEPIEAADVDDDDYDYEEEQADYSSMPIDLGKRRTAQAEELDWRPRKEPEPISLSSKRPKKDSGPRPRAKEPEDVEDHREGAPRYHQVAPTDEYDEYETEDNTAPLKIIIASLSLIFICVLAVLVFKINNVTTELETAQAEMKNRYTEEAYQAAVAVGEENKREADKLSREIEELRAQMTRGAYFDGSTPSGQTTYVIESGDTLGGIAVKFDVSVTNLMEWNALTDDKIQQGKTLIVADPNAPPVDESGEAEAGE